MLFELVEVNMFIEKFPITKSEKNNHFLVTQSPNFGNIFEFDPKMTENYKFSN